MSRPDPFLRTPANPGTARPRSIARLGRPGPPDLEHRRRRAGPLCRLLGIDPRRMADRLHRVGVLPDRLRPVRRHRGGRRRNGRDPATPSSCDRASRARGARNDRDDAQALRREPRTRGSLSSAGLNRHASKRKPRTLERGIANSHCRNRLSARSRSGSRCASRCPGSRAGCRRRIPDRPSASGSRRRCSCRAASASSRRARR